VSTFALSPFHLGLHLNSSLILFVILSDLGEESALLRQISILQAHATVFKRRALAAASVVSFVILVVGLRPATQGIDRAMPTMSALVLTWKHEEVHGVRGF